MIAHSEPLLPEIRQALGETFGVPVVNVWGTSEAGGNGVSCLSGPWLHLADDLMITEPVDASGNPVAPGRRADKLYLTNLYNHTLPLIRYELTDQITVLDDGECPCGCTHQRIADPHGRLDDTFSYGPIAVHPHTFRSALSRRHQVVEYQVRQTRRGAAINVRVTAPFDVAALRTELAGELARLGLPDPEVLITPVERLPRPTSGKLTRFVPFG